MNTAEKRVKGFNPLCSLGRFLGRAVTGRMKGMPHYAGKTVTFSDGAAFTVFRTIMIQPGGSPGGALFVVRFTPKSMSLAANRVFSLAPIPFFTGLPGFRAKCWMENRETGACAGVYQWDSAETAASYSRSFAVKFMTRRSVPGSVSYTVIPVMVMADYLKDKIS